MLRGISEPISPCLPHDHEDANREDLKDSSPQTMVQPEERSAELCYLQGFFIELFELGLNSPILQNTANLCSTLCKV